MEKSDEVEYATLDWVAWYNNKRLLEPIGYVPPVEYEQMYHQEKTATAAGAGVN